MSAPMELRTTVQPTAAEPIKVSILVMTYNHGRFIEQALESILAQQVTFPYEILISEDCSTDGTREIVMAYQQRHPHLIRLLLSTTNLHSNAVVVRGFDAARGQYLAMLDGDDYWTSPQKLQRQVEFLDAHPECALCFHNVETHDEIGGRAPWRWTSERQRRITTVDDIWLGNFIATCSVMFRLGLVGPLPAWYIDMFPITDWPLHILHAYHGTIGYLDEVMGVYRLHQDGYFAPLAEERKLAATLAFYRTMNTNLGAAYSATIKSAQSRYFFDWARLYHARGDAERAWWCLRACWSGYPFGGAISRRALLRMTAQLGMAKLGTRLRPRSASRT